MKNESEGNLQLVIVFHPFNFTGHLLNWIIYWMKYTTDIPICVGPQ